MVTSSRLDTDGPLGIWGQKFKSMEKRKRMIGGVGPRVLSTWRRDVDLNELDMI